MKRTIFFALISLFFFRATAQQNDTLTNEIIIKLQKAGFSSDILKSKIQSSPTKFDVSLDGMLSLKKAGVPEDVINLMISKPQGNNAVEKTVSKPEEPKLEQGIYYLGATSSQNVELEPNMMTSSKSSGLGHISGIFNSKSTASLSGKEASTQITDSSPKFLFVFDTLSDNNLNSQKRSFSSVRSPNEFVLVKLNVEKNSREITVGKGNNLKETSGIDQDQIELFSFKKISKGVYEVQPKELLPAGEYCFMFADGIKAGETNKVFDFGCTPKKGF